MEVSVRRGFCLLIVEQSSQLTLTIYIPVPYMCVYVCIYMLGYDLIYVYTLFVYTMI